MAVRRGRAVVVGALVACAAVAAMLWLRAHPRARRAGGTASARRLIVVGLDAADWQLLDPYVAEGRMPNLARLLREGRSGTLHTLVPPLSPLVWTTMMTGTSPLQHRILDFTRFNPTTGAREPITSDERRAKAVWEIASEAQKDVAVFAMWATHPAEPVRGLMVSDRLFSFQRDEAEAPTGAVYPAAEEGRVRAARREAEQGVSLAALQAYLPWLTAPEYESLLAQRNPYEHPVTALRRILIETRLYHRLASQWLRERNPALAVVYIQGTDSIGHVFAPFAPPRQAAIAQSDFDRYSRVPETYFREIDALLGEYAAIAESNGAVLLVVSDHGFLWGEGRPARPDSLARETAGLWHRDQGIALLWGQGIAPSAARSAGEVGQVGATILALLGLPRGKGLQEPALDGIAETAEVRDYGPRTATAPPAVPADPAAQEAIEKLRALGYVGGAEPAARSAAGSGTRTSGSYNNEGLLLQASGRTADARTAFEEALQVDAHNASAKHNLSEILLQGTPAESARADALLLSALEDGLGNGDRLVLSVARLHEKSGDHARAERLVAAAADRLPASPQLRLYRGRSRLEARDCRGALADFDVARKGLPQLALAHGLAGTALLCLGREAEARAAFARSLELDPDQPRLRAALAAVR
jgi:tetratricopeptide (TPR) repeat protein